MSPLSHFNIPVYGVNDQVNPSTRSIPPSRKFLSFIRKIKKKKQENPFHCKIDTYQIIIDTENTFVAIQ